MNPTEPAKDCEDPSRPASAQHILLYPEQEVGVTYRAGDDRQEYIYYDYSSGSLVNRVLGPQSHQAGGFAWGRGVAADINADGYDEIIQVGRRSSNDQLTVQTFVYGPDYAQSTAGSSWFAQDARLIGDEIKWMDIADGNFQGHSNGQRDIVVALRNDDGDLEIIPFFATGLTLAPKPSFHDATDGRESVWHVAVATGDVSGEGYDDIVAAFKDGGHHLQVLALRWNGTALTKLASIRFADPAKSHGAEEVAGEGDYNDYPNKGVDVTTGDVDGDGRPEAVVAFVDDDNKNQVMALGLSKSGSSATPDPYVWSDEGYYAVNPDTKDARWISVATPDLNGDGIAEILVAFGARWNCCSGDAPAQIWRLNYSPWIDDPNFSSDQGTMINRDLILKDRASYDNDDYNNASIGSIETVNVDRGERDRAILAFNGSRGPDDTIQTRVLEEPGDAKSLRIAATAGYNASADTNYDVTAIAGDVNKDSRWLTYKNVCKQYAVSAVNTVLNMPPIWYEKNEPHTAIGVALGRSMSSAASIGETTTTKYGGSYTVDASLSLADVVEVGPKAKVAFEGSHAVETEETVEFSTATKTSASFAYNSTGGVVIQDTLNYRVYQYEEDVTGGDVRVRVPAGVSTFPDGVEAWTQRQANRGWLPVGPGPRVNLAIGHYATQSSTYNLSAADRAVDGNTDGNWFNGSVSHTASQAGAWWKVDLSSGETASNKPIESVSIWNRTDAVPERLQNYVVDVLNKDGALVWTSPTQTTTAGTPTVVPVHRSGRYVRVRLLGANYLTLAEVQVWKELGENLAHGKPASQSSTDAGAVAGRALDGNRDGALAGNSVAATTAEAGAWWQVDLEEEHAIGEVDVWNTTDDCCKNAPAEFWVKVSNTGTDWNDPPWKMLYHFPPGRPTAVMVGTLGRYVRIEASGTAALRLAEVEVIKGREVPDYPKALYRNGDNYFTVTNWDGSQERVVGNLKWDWCQGYMDPDATASDKNDTLIKDLVAKQQPPKVYSGSADTEWETSEAFENTQSWEDTWGLMFSFGMEAKVLGMGAEWEVSGGFEMADSSSLSQTKETYFEGNASAYGPWPDSEFRYEYCPYYYVTAAAAADGVNQAYTVLDYYVPCYGGACSWAGASSAPAPAAAAAGVAPATPLIASPTHPDPNAWYDEGTVTFTWGQPEGDPETHPSYAWVLDRAPDTAPEPVAQGSRQTKTYHDLDDGAWYLHVRARGPDGQWSAAAHRAARIDTAAPVVTLALDPPVPNGNQGWYTVPVTAAVNASDAGAGVAAVEVSVDGGPWQPYIAPLHFDADTAATTLRARATDAAGRVSEPVSTTLSIDMTPPSSKHPSACAPGMICSGGIYEGLSRIAGMEIQIDDDSWTSVSSLGQWQAGGLTSPWVYAALLEVGNGHHIVRGRAADGAGNIEAATVIKEVTFIPTASPDLSASRITVEPPIARPGETVTVTVDLRNGGFQEAYVAAAVTLPAGVTPAPGALATLDGSIPYDPATGVITWPLELIWPGEHHQRQFQAIVAPGTTAGALAARLDALGSWPNIDMVSAEEQAQFRAREDTVTATAPLTVDPALAASRDVTAPHARLTLPAAEQLSAPGQSRLSLWASADARQMYLREWTLDPATGAWSTVRDSGWLPYAPSTLWALSEGAGVHYVGAWVADGAGNISPLTEETLTYANRLAPDTLGAGQRRQYRFPFEQAEQVFNVLTAAGQADLYVWLPGHGHTPDYVAEGPDALKALWFPIILPGAHQLEVMAVGDTAYTLFHATAAPAEGAAATAPAPQSAAPERPLTMTTPLTAGLTAAPPLDRTPIYLPMIAR
jgi:hypothetical protein